MLPLKFSSPLARSSRGLESTTSNDATGAHGKSQELQAEAHLVENAPEVAISSGARAHLTRVMRQSLTSGPTGLPIDEDPVSQAVRIALAHEDVDANSVAESETAPPAEPAQGDTEAETSSELSEAELQEIDELKSRDREVKTHEQAHIAAAQGHVRGGPRYQYETGPDGRQYAVAGKVFLDTSPVPGDPDATVRKAEVIKRAALAPNEPSGQDRKVAAKAVRMAAEARQEQRLEQVDETRRAFEAETEGAEVNSSKVRRYGSGMTTSILEEDKKPKETSALNSSKEAPKVKHIHIKA